MQLSPRKQQKIHYHHIVKDLQQLIRSSHGYCDLDFKFLRQTLSQYYGINEEELLRQGLRRAYRQLIEGI